MQVVVTLVVNLFVCRMQNITILVPAVQVVVAKLYKNSFLIILFYYNPLDLSRLFSKRFLFRHDFFRIPCFFFWFFSANLAIEKNLLFAPIQRHHLKCILLPFKDTFRSNLKITKNSSKTPVRGIVSVIKAILPFLVQKQSIFHDICLIRCRLKSIIF